jgi:protein associated with RNAse G/E
MVQSTSFKHDGSVAKIFHGMKLIQHDADVCVQFSDVGARVDVVNKNSHWIAQYSAYKVYPKNAWYNFVIVEKEGGLEYYCNVAAPPEIDADGNVTYIDYDVDVILSPDGTITVHDEEQFASRVTLMGYSDDIVTKVQAKTAWLVHALTERSCYFSADFYKELCNNNH